MGLGKLLCLFGYHRPYFKEPVVTVYGSLQYQVCGRCCGLYCMEFGFEVLKTWMGTRRGIEFGHTIADLDHPEVVPLVFVEIKQLGSSHIFHFNSSDSGVYIVHKRVRRGRAYRIVMQEVEKFLKKLQEPPQPVNTVLAVGAVTIDATAMRSFVCHDNNGSAIIAMPAKLTPINYIGDDCRGVL